MRVPAKVIWLSASEGGRAGLPETHRYVTISRFADDGPNWPDGAWSVVLDFRITPSEQGSPSLGDASFLMNSAPHERLHPGQRFDLYEGLRRVAVVELEGPGRL